MMQLIKTDPLVKEEINISKIIRYLFKNCLFEINDQEIIINNAICKAKSTRMTVLELLALLVKDNPK